MIAADTSVWIDFSKGNETPQTLLFEEALSSQRIVLPMPVLFEVLSGPGLTSSAASFIIQLPHLEIMLGFWERSAELRRTLLKRKLRARGMDCLIAQSCIDHGVPLLTSDDNFRHFSKLGLQTIPPLTP